MTKWGVEILIPIVPLELPMERIWTFTPDPKCYKKKKKHDQRKKQLPKG